jgi:hypothetical protein
MIQSLMTTASQHLKMAEQMATMPGSSVYVHNMAAVQVLNGLARALIEARDSE